MRLLAEFLERLTTGLEAGGVDYMVAGSLAAAFHGEPRATQDADLVVRLAPTQVGPLLAQFPSDAFYVSAEAARDAVVRRSQFNVIDMRTGWKADLVVLRGC